MTRTSSARAADRERGDIVLGWLTRLTVTLGLLGLVGFDLLSLGVGRLQVEDRASSAARAAQTAYAGGRDVQQAYDAAVRQLADDGAGADQVDPASFSVAQDGTVTLTVRHRARTLLLDRTSATRSWTLSRATASAAPLR